MKGKLEIITLNIEEEGKKILEEEVKQKRFKIR